VKELLSQLVEGQPLIEEQTVAAFRQIMAGEADPIQVGAMLAMIQMRGPTVEELTGAARVLRARAHRIAAPPGAIDVCGTGGDGLGSWNVSTAVAFVVAACGVPVAKHGNRAASSRSGAADVLEALGLDLEAATRHAEEALAEIGIAFLMAPRYHLAMRHVANIRAELGHRTLFNLLGPLINPADTRRQLIGVYDPAWLEPVAWALHALGCKSAWVVHGEDGLDELTVTGPSRVAELSQGMVHLFTVTPEDAGLPRHPPAALTGGDAAANAEALRALLAGRGGAYRDIVRFNAAAALVVAGKAVTLQGGVALATAALDEGRAAAKLDSLLARAGRAPAAEAP